MPATGAIAAPPIPRRWMWLAARFGQIRAHDAHAGSRISKHAAARRSTSSARTPRGSVSIARSVCPMGAPQTIGTPSGPRMRPRDMIPPFRLPAGGVAFRKIAENDAGDAAKLPRLLEMHQRAIHLVRLHAAVFQQQDGACGVEFPRRAQRGFHKREAAAEKHALRLLPRAIGAPCEINRPAVLASR